MSKENIFISAKDLEGILKALQDSHASDAKAQMNKNDFEAAHASLDCAKTLRIAGVLASSHYRALTPQNTNRQDQKNKI